MPTVYVRATGDGSFWHGGSLTHGVPKRTVPGGMVPNGMPTNYMKN